MALQEETQLSTSLSLVPTRPELAHEALVDHVIIRANRMAASLVESSLSPRVIVNEAGHVVYANDLFLRMLQTATIENVFHLQIRTNCENPRPPKRVRPSARHQRHASASLQRRCFEILALRDNDAPACLELDGESGGYRRKFAVSSLPLRMSNRTFALLELAAQP